MLEVVTRGIWAMALLWSFLGFLIDFAHRFYIYSWVSFLEPFEEAQVAQPLLAGFFAASCDARACPSCAFTCASAKRVHCRAARSLLHAA